MPRWPWTRPHPPQEAPSAQLVPVRRGVRVLAAATSTAVVPSASGGVGGYLAGATAERAADTSDSARMWQAVAWRHRSRIGPLRGGLAWQADTLGGIHYTLGVKIPGEDQPVPADEPQARNAVGAQLLADAQTQLDRLPLDDSTFKSNLASNLLTAGEVHLHGYAAGGSTEQWETMSIYQVRPLPGSRDPQIRDSDTGHWRDLDDDEALLRVHCPDPAFPWLADAPLRSLSDECQQVLLCMMELRALGLSRTANNGYLLMPDGMTLIRQTPDENGNYDVALDDEEFMAELTAASMAPITNPGDPGAIMPIVIRGAADDLGKVEHIRVDRADAAAVLERYSGFLHVIFQSLDLPVEQAEGLGSMKYWNAFVLTADRYKSYIQPKAMLVADRLAASFIRPPMVTELRHDPQLVRRLRLIPVGDHLIVHPNRFEDAARALDSFAVGPRALRQAGAFSEADAPDDDELELMLAVKMGGDLAEARELLRVLRGGTPTQRAPDDGEPAGDPAPASPAAQPAPAPAPATPAPDGATAGRRVVFAAGTDSEPGRRLAELDHNLRDRLVVAADAALGRAIEQAAARLRSTARADLELRAQLRHCALVDVGRVVGRERAATFGVDVRRLLTTAWDGLRASFETWVADTVRTAAAVIARALRLSDAGAADLANRFSTAAAPRTTTGWELLQERLEELADAALFDPASPLGEPGEAHYGRVPPGLVRQALAVVGGWSDPSVGGIAVSRESVDAFSSAGWTTTGYLWRYGGTLLANTFEPHLIRDTQVFDSRQDEGLRADPEYVSLVGAYYRPGDHPGCRCDWVTLWRAPER